MGILGFIPGITTDYDSMKFADHEARLVPPFLFGSAAIYAVLTIYGIVIDKESGANFVPVDSADNWLHLALTIALAGLGFYVKKRLEGTVRHTT